MILIYGECHQNAALALRTYRERYSRTRVCPSDQRIFTRAVQRLRDNQSLVPQQVEIPPRIPVALEERILHHFNQNPTSSLRRAGRQFQVHHKTVHRIFKKNKRKAFKYQKVQALLHRDMPVREAYCQWLLTKIESDSNFLFNVMWTDESTFTRNGMWNRQNLRHWSRENPHLVRESAHQYRFAVNVWAGIHGNQIIGPVFIEGNLNGPKFLELLDETVAVYVAGLPEEEQRRLWYQLDGAPAHSVVAARERLNDMFGEQWIGRYGPSRWPARSPDLTPLDFFLWGRIKNEVYATDVTNVEDLKI